MLKTLEMLGLSHSDNCNLCPHNCGINRNIDERGYCNCGIAPLVASVFLHKGEEPVISGTKGICNVFFAHCNMQCKFCQNYQISQNNIEDNSWITSYECVVEKIVSQIDQGVRLLGFVSPSHQISQMVEIIERVKNKGYNPTIVYNSNGYESVETLKMLEGIVDVYLPDFKYYDNEIGKQFSDVPDYFDIASKALKEMYRQKGSTLFLDDDGLVESGIIVRHLVLPNFSDDSVKIIEFIAENISTNIHISLMSQYYPTCNVMNNLLLNRTLDVKEYAMVVDKIEELGFRGWIQELNSQTFYQPDFSRNSPFKE